MRKVLFAVTVSVFVSGAAFAGGSAFAELNSNMTVPARIGVLVETPKAPADAQPRFTDNSDGTATDNITGLMWAKDGFGAGCDSGGKLNWTEALSFCDRLTFATHTDWRLPDTRELTELMKYLKGNPSTPYFANTARGYYWSSSEYEPGSVNAWYVDFLNGGVGKSGKIYHLYVRCVRAGS